MQLLKQRRHTAETNGLETDVENNSSNKSNNSNNDDDDGVGDSKPSNRKKRTPVRTAVVGVLLITTLWTIRYHVAATPSSSSSSSATTKDAATTKKGGFATIPPAARRVACVDKSQTSVVRAFKARGFEVRDLAGYDWAPLEKCYEQGTGSIVWTKHVPPKRLWSKARPWQRHSWLPHQNTMSSKAKLLRSLRDYETSRDGGRPIDFVPETYLLPRDRERLLTRLDDGENGGGGGGTRESWVVKLSATDNGVGIAMLGANSTELLALRDILRASDDARTFVPRVRQEIVFDQKNDKRKKGEIDRAKKRSSRQNDDVIVQRYVCDELAHRGKKFDLRVYFLIASVRPLAAYYFGGYLRVSNNKYNDKVFGSTHEHLTNLGRNKLSNDNTVSFDDWGIELRRHVDAEPSYLASSSSSSSLARSDPVEHVNRQIMSALADVVAANRDQAFGGHGGAYTTMEDGFALMGADFIVDRRLNVWMTEAQSSPGMGHETDTKRALNDRLLPAVVDVLAEVTDKRTAGAPLLPLTSATDVFRLVYADDHHFRYEHDRGGARDGGSC